MCGYSWLSIVDVWLFLIGDSWLVIDHQVVTCWIEPRWRPWFEPRYPDDAIHMLWRLWKVCSFVCWLFDWFVGWLFVWLWGKHQRHTYIHACTRRHHSTATPPSLHINSPPPPLPSNTSTHPLFTNTFSHTSFLHLPPTTYHPSDVMIANCLQSIGITAYDSRDAMGRLRFHCVTPSARYTRPVSTIEGFSWGMDR